MRVRDITERHQYPSWLLRFPRLIYIHYATLQILFLRSRVCRRTIKSLLLHRRKKGFRILDAGCGEGQHLIPSAARFPNLSFTGIDHATGHIDFLQKLAKKKGLANCTFEKTDIKTYLSDAPSYDLIYLIGVLQYTVHPDNLLELLAHSQISGQQLFLYTPIKTDLHFRFYQWMRKKYGHYDDAQDGYAPIEETELYAWVAKANYRITRKEYHYRTYGTLGHEIMQSLIILITHWPLLLKIIPGLFFIILIPIFVSLQVVDTWSPSNSPEQGNGLLLILEKQSIRG